MKVDEDIVLIAGPTASGKTGLAIEIANANNGVIINADSMQIYSDLRIITARPSAKEEASAPHYLFGFKSGAEAFSVAQWLAAVEALLSQFRGEGLKLIFVGGTGLYFNALINGLSPVPEIDPAIRNKWRDASDVATEDLHKELSALDELAAIQLRTSDRQRIIRALEVYESSGKSIFDWQEEQGEPLLTSELNLKKLLLMPERKLLHERINLRFDLMIDEGAIREVELLVDQKLDPKLPVMKAIGVPQIASYLRDEVSLEDAIEKAKAATRQYAKRQSTWFRNSFDGGWETL
ncbi:MAG: tRNA (adenosine(37)-N6)-dimethylallyltransferase MiaA [Pseudomonadota bacterium]